MTDRELLEAAAKAAGLTLDRSFEGRAFDVLGNAVLDWFNGTTWNPIADDGDALRLAVKLELDLTKLQAGISWDDEDRYAATRRAIVRAAAAIGKDMT